MPTTTISDRAQSQRDAAYVSDAELSRAYLAYVQALYEVDHARLAPPHGPPGTLEELLLRAHRFLEQHPGHAAAQQRYAELEAELYRRIETARLAYDHLLRLVERYEARQGFACPGVRDEGHIVCQQLAATQGWTCGLAQARRVTLRQMRPELRAVTGPGIPEETT
jgi:hypothetical protein